MENSENSYLEQVNQLLSFLKEKEKRKSVLELLLGLTDNEEMQKVFLQTEIAKTMIRQLEADEPEDRELVLQIIINLSGEENFQKQFLSLNAIYRICTLLMQRVDKEVSKENNKETLSGPSDIYDLATLTKKDGSNIKLILDKYVIDLDSIKKSSSGELIEVPYYLMILTNLTISEEGQKKFLNVEDEKITGVVFMKILDKFFQYIYDEEFNFCSGLIANISSLKEGRTLILEYKIFKIFLIHVDKMNNFKIINMLRLIRNCCFEFENHKEEILIKDAILFSYLMKILILTNITEKKELQDIGIFHIDSIYFTHFCAEIAQQDKETINDIIVDIFLILTNLTEAVEHMKLKDLYKALKQIGDRIGTDESLRNRLDVVKSYLEGFEVSQI